MKPESLYAGDGVSTSAGLFALAGFMLFVSMLCPVAEVMGYTLYGWMMVYITALGSVTGLWYLVTRNEAIPAFAVVLMLIGLFANLTLLTTALFGRKLRHRHAVPMLTLAINGLLAGLIMPAMMFFARNTYRSDFEGYGQLQIGYWLWIASLALVAAGWWSVVWTRRRLRKTIIARSQLPPPAEYYHHPD